MLVRVHEYEKKGHDCARSPARSCSAHKRTPGRWRRQELCHCLRARVCVCVCVCVCLGRARGPQARPPHPAQNKQPGVTPPTERAHPPKQHHETAPFPKHTHKHRPPHRRHRRPHPHRPTSSGSPIRSSTATASARTSPTKCARARRLLEGAAPPPRRPRSSAASAISRGCTRAWAARPGAPSCRRCPKRRR